LGYGSGRGILNMSMRVKEVIIPKELILLVAFSIALNLLRVLVFNSLSLIYLLWNIFLAFLPFLISSAITWHVHHAKVSRYELWLGGAFWLLLFPNAPYLMTDFIHLGHTRVVPTWFDILVIFSAAWVGLQFSFYSLLNIEELLSRRFTIGTARRLLVPILLFTSFGIYLGRFPRFNSWDIITNPIDLMRTIWRIGIGAENFPEAFFFTFLFFGFLWVTYTAWKLSKNARI
jgi:uncharacterized membrane protein